LFKGKGKITVGIPFYRGTAREELVAAVDSILGQSFKPAVIQLIQDGPVREELALTVEKYLAEDSCFVHLRIEVQRGLAYALNLSILEADTEYYARMDSDDISHPRRLEKQRVFLEENPQVEMVGTWLLEYEKNIDHPENRIRQVPAGQDEIYRLFHYRNPLNHPTIMFRRSMFAEIGMYNSAFKRAQDTELYARAFKKLVGVANIPEVLYYMRASTMLERRASFAQLKYQMLGRYKYNTWSPYLNLLKIASLLFRLLPIRIQQYGYDKYRW